jgi:acyl-CoA reductase-like NAD-dependent aldehyde dehydrogenase
MVSTNGVNAGSGSDNFGIVIGNKDITTSSRFEVPDPITGKAVHNAPAATEQDAISAVESAKAAFPAWSETTPIERRTIFNKALEIFLSRKDEIVAAMVRETGAKASWAAFNVKIGAEFIMEGAAMATQINGSILQSNDKGTLAMIFKEPVGVVLGIAPWNAPIILGLRAFLIPVICGNTVILKASENSPYTQYLLVDTFRKAGLPPGVVNFLCCPRTSAGVVTEAIVKHPAVQKVNFTGSTAVGRIISGMCSKYLKPVILELGGKAPMIVLKSANLEEACKAAAFGAMQHQGQICMSTERIIVHSSVAAQFEALFKAKIESLYAADPSKDQNAPLSCLINSTAGQRVYKLVDDALSKGAVLAAGKLEVDGAVVQPLALKNVDKSMDIFYQESFGPTVSIFEFETVEEAIALANDTEYGLVSSVYGDDISQALAVARKIRSGSCHINGPSVHGK